MKITIDVTVAVLIEQVWNAWTTPSEIKQWNAASPMTGTRRLPL
jgi:uncharacterized protein YndB with AHSA1/START domain